MTFICFCTGRFYDEIQEVLMSRRFFIPLLCLSFCYAVENHFMIQARGLQSDEVGAYLDFSTAEIRRWEKDSQKICIVQDGKGSKIQDGNGNNLTDKFAQLIDVGDGDKVVAVKMSRNPSKIEYFINYSDQARKLQDVSQSSITLRFFIPPALLDSNYKNHIKINFRLWDSKWNYYSLGKEFQNDFSADDLSTGWQTVKINFKEGSVITDKSSRKINISKDLMVNSSAFSMVISHKRFDKEQQLEPVYIDWVRIDAE